MDYVTPKGATLGECTPEELRNMLDFCISKPKNRVAVAMKGHIETLLDYLKPFEPAAEVNNILHEPPPQDI